MYKFISSNYDEKTGISKVTIKYDNKLFTGTSLLRDGDYPSKFTGCRYAEIKAAIKAARYKYNKDKINYQNCEELVYKAMECKVFDRDTATAKALFHQLNIVKKKMINSLNNLNALEDMLADSIKYQDIMNKKGERD